MAVKEFNYRELKKLSLSHDLLNMMTKIHEYKGKQALFLRQKPVELNRLAIYHFIVDIYKFTKQLPAPLF